MVAATCVPRIPIDSKLERLGKLTMGVGQTARRVERMDARGAGKVV